MVVWTISSGMLKLVSVFPAIYCVIGLLASTAAAPLWADETATAKNADTFFAGAVMELNRRHHRRGQNGARQSREPDVPTDAADENRGQAGTESPGDRALSYR